VRPIRWGGGEDSGVVLTVGKRSGRVCRAKVPSAPAPGTGGWGAVPWGWERSARVSDR